MNIKLDENLPLQLAINLRKLGHDVHTVHSEGLTGHKDREIWEAAASEGRFLITQDLDFADIRRYPPDAQSGVLILRLSNPSRKNLIAFVEHLLRTESVADWKSCVLIATERKTRRLKLSS